jgi:hypothetical protein
MPAFDRKTPQRAPQGMSIYPPRHLLRNFSYLSNDYLIYKNEDFLPYRSVDYTVTQTNGTAAQFNSNGGSVKLSTAGSTGADKIMLANQAPFQQFMLGNQQFFDARVAISGAFTDTNMYCGLSDNADLSAATNGVYFLKPSGGTSVNFVIKKGGTTTTFVNIADLAKPSGIFGDAFSTPATASATIAGGNYTLPVITAPGSGYRVSPLALATGATGANATLAATVGGSALPTQNPSGLSTQIPYAPVANLWIVNAGNAAYTTGTIEIDPWINLEFYYNGFGVLIAGVNGREILAIRGGAVDQGFTTITAGQSYTLGTAGVGPSFNAGGTQLTTTNFGPTPPQAGDPMNILPLTQLQMVCGFVNTTANPRAMYWDEYNVATEFN